MPFCYPSPKCYLKFSFSMLATKKKKMTVVRPLMCLAARPSAVSFSLSFILPAVLQNANKNI